MIAAASSPAIALAANWFHEALLDRPLNPAPDGDVKRYSNSGLVE
jgi:hypothetical protein